MTAITRCEQCNEWTQGFHFCLDDKTPLNLSQPIEGVTVPKTVTKRAGVNAATPRTLTTHKRTRRNEEIVRMYANGATCSATGIAFDISSSSVRNVLRAAGVTIRGDYQGGRPGIKERSADDIDLVIDMYRNGSTLNEIKDRMHWHQETVARILRENDVEVRRAGTQRKDADEATSARVAASYRDGVQIKTIAWSESVSVAVVSRWLREAGVTLRPGPNVHRGNREHLITEVARLRAESVSIRKVAVQLGISVSTVERMMREQRAVA